MAENLVRAQALIDVGRYDDASMALAAELRADPESWRAHALLAVIALRRDRPDRALTDAARAARFAPNQELPHRLSAAAHLALGHGMKALASARQAVELAPSNWATHAALATCLLNRQTRDDRVEAHEAAVLACELAPMQAEAHIAVARVRTAMADNRGANRAYRRALELDPENLEAIHELGVNEVNAGRVKAGSDKIRSAAAAAPHEAILRINTQDTARIWLWRAVDWVVALLIAQVVARLSPASSETHLTVSLTLTAMLVGVVIWSYQRLDPLVRRLVWRFQFGNHHSEQSQTKAKVILALAFVDSATLGTPLDFWPLDLAGLAVVVMSLGRWRNRSYHLMRRLWRQWSHRRALAKRVRLTAAADE